MNDSGGMGPPVVPIKEEFQYQNFTVGEHISYSTFADLIIESDPSTLINIDYIDIVTRYFLEDGSEYQAYLFESQYPNNKIIDILVYNNMSQEEADEIAMTYAYKIGQLPEGIYSGVFALHVFITEKDMVMHSGRFTEHSQEKSSDIYYDSVEELLLHSFTHASLDFNFENRWPILDPKDFRTIHPHVGIIEKDVWMSAVSLDNFYLTQYAANNPYTEDVAETIYAYLASRWRPDRFDPELIDYVETKLHHRFLVLDNLQLKLP